MWLAIIGVINSVVSAYYYVRVIRVMFKNDDSNKETDLMKTGLFVKLAIVVSSVITVWLGIMPSWMLGMAEIAAVSLVGLVK